MKFAILITLAVTLVLTGRTQAGAVMGGPIVILDRTGNIELARIESEQEFPQRWLAPHFVRLVRRQLLELLCRSDQPCAEFKTGDLRVKTSLDWRLQKAAERLLYSSIVTSSAEQRHRNPWQVNILDSAIANGALTAIDYRSGAVLAYAGSADFNGFPSPRFQPAFDVLDQAWRQTGSILKPFVYLTGIESGRFTLATLFMDVETEMEPGYTPRNSDGLERGPVRLRDALAYSLNIPAVKAAQLLGEQSIRGTADRFAIDFNPHARAPGNAFALGAAEVRPITMASAYAALANQGVWVERILILQVIDRTGAERPLPPPVQVTATSPETAYQITSALSRETMSANNPVLGRFGVKAAGERKPVAIKTGTSDGSRDLWTAGYLPPPVKDSDPALAILVWLGNSDNSPAAKRNAHSTAAPLWHAFASAAVKEIRLGKFERPPGLAQQKIDAHSGYAPGPWSTKTLMEWFPTAVSVAVDPTKTKRRCGAKEEWFWDLGAVEAANKAWQAANYRWSAQFAAAQTSATLTPFYDRSYQPYGDGWSAKFTCKVKAAPERAAKN